MKSIISFIKEVFRERTEDEMFRDFIRNKPIASPADIEYWFKIYQYTKRGNYY